MSVELVQETARGRVRAVGVDREHIEQAIEIALSQWSAEPAACAPLELGGESLWFKGSTLRGKAALRHGTRGFILRRALPRVNELRNLEWLRARLFQAPRPVAAGVFASGGLPRYQFLITEALPGVRTLREHFADASEGDRERVLTTLARETARMHSLGFVHRDLYPRNLLVANDVWFIDAWRGGPGFSLRGADNDLACLMLHGAELFDGDEQQLLFDVYFAERAAQDRAVERAPFLAGVVRNRSRLLKRLAERPDERRGRELPTATWSPPASVRP